MRPAGRRAPPGCPPTTPTVEVRYRDPTQMGKVYLAAGRRRAADPGLRRPELGPGRRRSGADARRSGETRIRRHPGELKNLLKNQAFVAGIGNAYSDEILHAARLLPFRKRSTPGPGGGRRPLRGDAARRWPMRSTSCASASRRRSRRRSATSWPSTTRAASPARAAGPGSPRSSPAGSSPRSAAAASADLAERSAGRRVVAIAHAASYRGA